jgi:hypothetical protein
MLSLKVSLPKRAWREVLCHMQHFLARMQASRLIEDGLARLGYKEGDIKVCRAADSDGAKNVITL